MKLYDYYRNASEVFYANVRKHGDRVYNGEDYFPDYLDTLSNFELIQFLAECSGEDIYD